MFPFKRDIKNRNINLADGAIGLLAGVCTLCWGVADLCLHAGALSDALAPLQALPSSSSCSLPSSQCWGRGALMGPCSNCSQADLISDSSEPAPKGGELLSDLITARFDGSGSTVCGAFRLWGSRESQF